MEKFPLNVKKWRRGKEAQEGNGLLNADGTSCCLGLFAIHLGVTNKPQLRTSSYPENLNRWHDIFPVGLTHLKQREMAKINDNAHLSEEYRRELLTKHFKDIGYEVEFVEDI